jgi:hypothetical protein
MASAKRMMLNEYKPSQKERKKKYAQPKQTIKCLSMSKTFRASN